LTGPSALFTDEVTKLPQQCLKGHLQLKGDVGLPKNIADDGEYLPKLVRGRYLRNLPLEELPDFELSVVDVEPANVQIVGAGDFLHLAQSFAAIQPESEEHLLLFTSEKRPVHD